MARIFSSIITPTKSLSLSCYRPVEVKMGQNQSYWASIETDIETYLKKSITIRQPESVFQPMQYLTFATPKTTASALCVAACELVGGDRDQAVAAASSIHLMHVAAYTHQHMEFMPNYVASRPGPGIGPEHATDQHKFGPSIELLTGDGIIPFGMELLTRAMSPALENSDKILRVVVEVTRAIGSQGLIEGQFREMEWTQQFGNGNEKMMEDVCKKKEGELHACGAACGGILGDGSDEEVESLRKYGLYVGIIQGIINGGVGRNYNKILMEKKVEELKVLAMKELKTNFKGKKVETFASLVEHAEIIGY